LNQASFDVDSVDVVASQAAASSEHQSKSLLELFTPDVWVTTVSLAALFFIMSVLQQCIGILTGHQLM
jgi:hypothetical protein